MSQIPIWFHAQVHPGTSGGDFKQISKVSLVNGLSHTGNIIIVLLEAFLKTSSNNVIQFRV